MPKNMVTKGAVEDDESESTQADGATLLASAPLAVPSLPAASPASAAAPAPAPQSARRTAETPHVTCGCVRISEATAASPKNDCMHASSPPSKNAVAEHTYTQTRGGIARNRRSNCSHRLAGDILSALVRIIQGVILLCAAITQARRSWSRQSGCAPSAQVRATCVMFAASVCMVPRLSPIQRENARMRGHTSTIIAMLCAASIRIITQSPIQTCSLLPCFERWAANSPRMVPCAHTTIG